MTKSDEKARPAAARRPLVPFLALCWLLVFAAFSLGVWTQWARVWPYDSIRRLQAFIEGDPDAEETSLGQKLENDLNLAPERHLVDPKVDFDVPGHYQALQGLPLKARRKPPRMFLSERANRGFRLVFGMFDFEEFLHGAILIDPQGAVRQVWQLTQEDVPWVHQPDPNVFPHGLAVLRDGSLIVAYDEGTKLSRHSFCNEAIWTLRGRYHHSVTEDGLGNVWTWGARDDPHAEGVHMLRLDLATGHVNRDIYMPIVAAKNSDIDIFGIRQNDTPYRSINDPDAWHMNDVEALSPDLAPHYPDFEAGDLLVSFRSPNLVFVISQKTLVVKWWRHGFVRRQHDPDFNTRGTITVFDNDMHRDFSRIVEIDPKTYKHRVLLDGKDYDFYSRIRGKHQQLEDGTLLVTSSQQGRVFEVNPAGEIVFEFVNPYDEERFLPLSEAVYLPPDYFDELPDCSRER